jgi:alkaline phosphatase
MKASACLFLYLFFFSFDSLAQDPPLTRAIPLRTASYPLKPPGDVTPYPLLPDREIRNIILFIGDGMGINQVLASRLRIYGPEGRFHIERMPVTGLASTDAEDTLIIDSGAAATALATGHKTSYNAISMTTDGKRLATILQRARDKGLGTGLVSTTEITDATPAAFAAHVPHRRDHNSIARQLVDSGFDVILGCGKKRFISQNLASVDREDSIDLIERIRSHGYDYFETADGMRAAKGKRLFGLFDTDLLMSDNPEPTIAEMTTKALDVLKQKENGFFLVVETERTDEESHGNHFENLADGMLAFDEAVKVALDYATKNKQTLVIVTADHETGGLQIDKGGPVTGTMQVAWTTRGHTGQMVPIYAFGPHAMKFTGTMHISEIPRRLAPLLRLKDFPMVLE